MMTTTMYSGNTEITEDLVFVDVAEDGSKHNPRVVNKDTMKTIGSTTTVERMTTKIRDSRITPIDRETKKLRVVVHDRLTGRLSENEQRIKVPHISLPTRIMRYLRRVACVAW